MLPTIKILAIFLIFFLVGAVTGGIIGFVQGVKITIKNALEVLPYFTNITINEQAITDALFQYKNRIGECTHALIYSNERN